MAINFPPITVNGQTYDYQGIRYTANVPGGDLAKGYWQVTTPGTYGIATAAEIDAGVDNVKYIVPSELGASKYNDVQASDVTYDDSASGIGTDVQAGMEVLALRPNPNLLINGGFDVWQRGVSFAGNAQNIFTADRFNSAFSYTASAPTVSRVTNPAGHISNCQYSYTFGAGAANVTGANISFIKTRLEKEVIRMVEGKEVTLSLFAEHTTSQTLGIMLVVGHTLGELQIQGQSITMDTTVSKSELTFQMPSFAGLVFDDNSYFEVRFIMACATGRSTEELCGVPSGWNWAGGNLAFSAMKLELDSVATPYQARLVGEELALCKRYYEVGRVELNAAQFQGNPFGTSTEFSVEKRINPVVVLNVISSVNLTAPLPANVVSSGFTLFSTAVSGTPGGCQINVDYKADAEL